MHYSLEQFQQLLQSEQFRNAPFQVMLESGAETWQDQVRILTEAGKASAIWQVCAGCAVLMTTYGQAISSIRPKWNIVTDGGDTYADMCPEINHDEITNPANIDLDTETMDQIVRADNGQALSEILEMLDNLMGDALKPKASDINLIFNEPVSRIEELIEISRQHAPGMNEKMEQAILEIHTIQATGNHKGPRL